MSENAKQSIDMLTVSLANFDDPSMVCHGFGVLVQAAMYFC